MSEIIRIYDMKKYHIDFIHIYTFTPHALYAVYKIVQGRSLD